MLLKLLLEQFGSQVALFFDNLESLQDATTRVLTDPELQLWIDAAVRLKAQGVKGLRVVLTSRWALPEWREQLYPLGKPVYRDFLAVAQQQKLPKEFLRDFKRLRQAYEVLGGNYRALEYFAAALLKMNTIEEEELVASLRQATEEIQTNMLLELVYSHREPAEQQLLRTLVAYEVPVAIEGVKALVLDELEQPERALEALLSVSLIERTENKTWQTEEFQVSPLVRDWLLRHGGAMVSSEQFQRAAGYLQWLLVNERSTVEQAIVTYAALISAGLNEEAYRITLDWIVEPMNRAGLYQALLDTWLQPVCNSTQPRTLAKGLGQVGNQYLYIAQYERALEYLNRSLAIQQEIGDKAGEGGSLNNISQIFSARGEYDKALEYLNGSLAIQQEIGDKAGEGGSLNNISQIFSARGEYDKALEYQNRSLAIQQEIGEKYGEGPTLNNIGEIYRLRGEYDRALEYLKRSLAIQKEIGDKSGEGRILNNISLIYYARGEYDPALDYLKRSLAIQQEIGDKSGEGTTLNNISQIYDARGDYNTALDYLKRSLAIRQEIGDSAGLCTTLFNIGHIYLQNNEFPNAVTLWVTVYRLAKPMNFARVLQSLESLAPQIGLPGGLEGWEQLSQQMGEAE